MEPGGLLVQLVDRSDDSTLAGSFSGAHIEYPPSVTAAIDLAARSRPDLVVLRVPLDEVARADALRRLHAVAPACRVVVLPFLPLAGPGADRGAPAVRGRADRPGLGPSPRPRPDVAAVVRARTLRPRAESARLARQIVLSACTDAAAEELCFDALLVGTELVTNAVNHARTALGLTVRAWPATVRIEVCDRLPERPALRPADVSSPNGRGLAIMTALCSAWGVDPTAKGKRVWAELVSRQPVPTAGF